MQADLVFFPQPMKIFQKSLCLVSLDTSFFDVWFHTGIATIKNEMKEMGLPEPEFQSFYIKKMKDNNIIKRVGSDRNGYWKILL